MSTPPYYQNTPPPAKSNSNGCLKAAGIGCVVIVLLGVIGSFLLVQQVKQAMKNPKGGGLFGTIVGAGQTGAQGVEIRQAIVAYHDKNGKYPAKLADLVPGFLPTAANLHTPSDSNADPNHISWTYMKPSPGAGPKTPLIKTVIDIEFGGQKQQSSVVINLDGTSVSKNGQPGTSM